MQTNWDIRFLELAKHVSGWSKDPSTQVGAVITEGKKIISVGYNGFPPGIADDDRLHCREIKYGLIVHAEINAIANTERNIQGCTLYTYPLAPCQDCMKTILTYGIKRIVYPKPSIEHSERWSDSLLAAKQVAEEAGVEMVQYDYGR